MKPACCKEIENGAVQAVFITASLMIFLHGAGHFCAQMLDHALTPDWPWLYRTGHYIIHHAGSVPATDLYSWTHPQQGWVVYQWLFEAGAAAVYSLLGQTPTVIAFTIVTLMIYVAAPTIILGKRGIPALLIFAVAGLVLPCVGVNFGLRPMLATSLFLLLQFELLGRWRAGKIGLPATLCVVAVIYALWANMHLGVVLGFLSIALFAAGEVVEAFAYRERRPAPEQGPSKVRYVWSAYMLIFITGLGSSLINPYGARIYWYLGNLSFKRTINSQIRELMPPDMSDPYLILAGCLVIVFLMTLYSARVRSGYRAYAVLHVLVFAGLTAFSVRFIVWAGLFYVLVTPLGLWHGMQVFARHLTVIKGGLERIRGVDRTLIIALLVAATALAVVIAPLARPAQVSGCVELHGAINYLKARYPANIRWFADDVAGSCTLLYTDERKVFADTRFDMYPQSFVAAWFDAMKGRPGWRHFFDAWDIQLVLVSKNRGLAGKLSHAPDFVRVYEDKHAYLFERE